MNILSLDPRVDRLKLSNESPYADNVVENEGYWDTYQVFHQKKRGQQHQHVGIVHAPNEEMALVFAKEQYARRGETTNLWIVKTANVFSMSYDDSDVFETTPEKIYREANGYKVMDKINAYKKEQAQKI